MSLVKPENKRIVLASQSPRRREILEMLGFELIIKPAFCDENSNEKDPSILPKELSKRKARFLKSEFGDELILGADTVVAVGESILGKPIDKNDALNMLRMLRGKSHSVFTGVTIIYGNREVSFSEETKVTMKDCSDELLQRYIDTMEPFDKAGSYGIQGFGAVLVDRIEGDFFNVMGLPAARVFHEIEKIKET